MSDTYKRSNELAANYMIGSCSKTVCLDILAGANPAVMASLVTKNIIRLGGFDMADEFIRILEDFVQNDNQE